MQLGIEFLEYILAVMPCKKRMFAYLLSDLVQTARLRLRVFFEKEAAFWAVVFGFDQWFGVDASRVMSGLMYSN